MGQRFVQPFFYEFIQLPSIEDKYQLYFSYRVSNKSILFEKKGENYNASFTIAIEIAEENSAEFKREFIQRKIVANSYEETIAENIFNEGLLQLEFSEGKYRCYVTFTDENGASELKLPPQIININKENNFNFFQPLIVYTKREHCGDMMFSRIANYGGNIPFDPKEYTIVIPVFDKSIERISVKLYNNNNLIYNEVVDNFSAGRIDLFTCDNKNFIRIVDDSIKYNLFFLEKISSKFKEGSLRLLIQKTDKPEERFSHTLNITWIQKPMSLKLNGIPVRVLEYLDDEENISHLKNARRSGIDSLLHLYWKKFDPTPATEFNELKQEFYNRVDYAIENFTTINGKNGAESDRGKYYIVLGKPDKIERSPSPDKGMYEVWHYEKSNKTLTFFDGKGVGNFILLSEQ